MSNNNGRDVFVQEPDQPESAASLEEANNVATSVDVEKAPYSYIVLFVYYKYGQYKFEYADDEDDLRSLLIDTIVEANGGYERRDAQQYVEEVRALDLSALIEKAKDCGQSVRDRQEGYGVAEIIKGRDIEAL